MAITKNQSNISRSEQNVLNKSMDDKFDVLAVEILGYASDGTLKRVSVDQSGNLNANSGAEINNYSTNDVDEALTTLTYVGKEDKDGNWCIQKIDTSSGTNIAYATVNNNSGINDYSTAWTNRTTLTYESYKDAF